MNVRVACILGLTIAVIGVGCSSTGKITRSGSGQSPTGGSGNPSTSGSVEWGDCDDYDIPISDDTRSLMESADMACATLAVPVQHAVPDGPTLELALGRIPATGPDSQRIGSLIVNPGGPGGSGLEFLASAAVAVPQILRERFDLVSFDPRGIGLSTPVNCLSEQRRKEVVEAETPDDPAQEAAQAVAIEAEIATGCDEAPDDLELHMGTDEVAGDVDAIREAVGDEQLTFLGLSYGTRIAAAYASRYPERVRALVLDGSVTPSRDLGDQAGGQIKGIGRSLNAFADWCNRDATCPLAPDAMGRIDATAAQVRTTPLEITTDRSGADPTETLDEDQFVTGLVTAMYDPSSYAATALAIAALSGSDPDRAQDGGRFLLSLAGQQNSQREDGTYGNGYEAQSIVNCLDADGPLETAELPAVRAEVGPIPAVLDSDPASDSPSCTALATGTDLVIDSSGPKERILLVGTVGDPATPIEWTDQMAEALGGPAVLRYGGNGHTASTRIDCVTEQVTAFLETAEVPANLSDCPADPGETDIYQVLADQFDDLGMGEGIGTCIADAVRDELDPLDIVGLSAEDPDPAVVQALQSAALSCR